MKTKLHFDKEKGDIDILNHASRTFGKQLKSTPYKGITIKEALIYIGHSNITIDIKG